MNELLPFLPDHLVSEVFANPVGNANYSLRSSYARRMTMIGCLQLGNCKQDSPQTGRQIHLVAAGPGYPAHLTVYCDLAGDFNIGTWRR